MRFHSSHVRADFNDTVAVIDAALLAADGDGGAAAAAAGGGAAAGAGLPRGMRWINVASAPLWQVLWQSVMPWYVLPGAPLVRDVPHHGW